MASTSSGGKGARKYNRTKNKPCQKRYTSEERWIKNKMRKALKLANKYGKEIRIKIKGDWTTVKPTKITVEKTA